MKFVWLILISIYIICDVFAHYHHQLTLSRWIVRYIPSFLFWLFMLWASLHIAWFYYRER